MKRFLLPLAAALAAIGVAYANPTATAPAGEKVAQQKDTAAKAVAPAKDAAKPDAHKAPGDTKKPEPMDINTASEKELATLPGIGEKRAAAIVGHRPYKGKDDLVHQKVIGRAEYEKIKHLIVAKQESKSPAPATTPAPAPKEPPKK